MGERKVRAHRAAYETAHGPIPAGLVIDHLCRNKVCCNPAHLEAVTQKVNTHRGTGPTAINAAKTHCDHGHPLVSRYGRRLCVDCKRIANRARKQRRRMTPTDAASPAVSSTPPHTGLGGPS